MHHLNWCNLFPLFGATLNAVQDALMIAEFVSTFGARFVACWRWLAVWCFMVAQFILPLIRHLARCSRDSRSKKQLPVLFDSNVCAHGVNGETLFSIHWKELVRV